MIGLSSRQAILVFVGYLPAVLLKLSNSCAIDLPMQVSCGGRAGGKGRVWSGAFGEGGVGGLCRQALVQSAGHFPAVLLKLSNSCAIDLPMQVSSEGRGGGRGVVLSGG